MIAALFAGAWAWIAPCLVWLWWAALAPAVQWLLHCCGLLWIGEWVAKWWAGDN